MIKRTDIQHGKLCDFQNLWVYMMCKFALFYPRSFFFGVSSQRGEVTVGREREILGGQGSFSLFGGEREESVYVRDLRPPCGFLGIRCHHDMKIGILGL